MKTLRLLILAGMLIATLIGAFAGPDNVAQAWGCINTHQYCENHRCVDCAGGKKQQAQGGELLWCDPGGDVCQGIGPWVDNGPCDWCAQ